MKISILWLILSTIFGLMMILINFLQKKLTWSKEKWTQFECGFNIMNPSHLPFSFQFFLVAILFLIFDIEIAIVLSYPLEPKMVSNMLTIFTFLLILTMGLVMEWQKGKIEWTS